MNVPHCARPLFCTPKNPYSVFVLLIKTPRRANSTGYVRGVLPAVLGLVGGAPARAGGGDTVRRRFIGGGRVRVFLQPSLASI